MSSGSVTEGSLRALLEQAPVGLIVVGADGMIAHATAPACRMLGLDELTGHPITEHLEADQFARACDAAMRGDAASVWLRGAHAPVQARVERRPDDPGFVMWLAEPHSGALADASALRASEVTLAHRTAEMRAIIDAFPDLYFWTDAQGRVIDYHTPRPEMLAFPPEHFMGKRWRDLFPGPLADQLEAAIEQALTTGEQVAFEYSLEIADQPAWFEARYVRVGDDRAVAIIRDITQRRKVEQEAHRVDALYRLVTDGLPVLVSYVDREERYRFVNRAYENTYRATREEFLGKHLSEVLPPPTYNTVIPYAQRALAGERVEFEVVLELGTGSRTTSVSYVPHRDQAGTVQGFVALVVDVTERRELERQLRHSQKMEALGRLAGGIAHDFNNLLMVITTSVALARRSLARGGDVKPELDNVETAANRAATLVRQLLAFSRRDDVRPQLLDLDSTVQQIRTMLARVIGEDVALSVSLQSRATVRADVGHIEQILMNLAVNARDAMPNGGVLSLESSRLDLAEGEHDLPAGPYARLTVTDTGVGMNSAIRARIFEPFFTTKDLDKGSGLGLATVYGIVSQCRGAITVASEVGRGTRFDIYLPISTGNVAEVPASTLVPTARGARILLVEDDESVRSVLKRALESEDYAVIEAGSGTEALALVDRETFDVVITDMIMPQSTGRAVVDQIRARRPGVPALFVSGYPEQHLAGLRLDSQSIDAYLAKPFRIDDVLATITRLLERARSAT